MEQMADFIYQYRKKNLKIHKNEHAVDQFTVDQISTTCWYSGTRTLAFGFIAPMNFPWPSSLWISGIDSPKKNRTSCL